MIGSKMVLGSHLVAVGMTMAALQTTLVSPDFIMDFIKNHVQSWAQTFFLPVLTSLAQYGREEVLETVATCVWSVANAAKQCSDLAREVI